MCELFGGKDASVLVCVADACAHACRHMLGLNADARSYFAGVALDNAGTPQRAIIRPQSGPASFQEAGANPATPEGALVNGPDVNGNYQVQLGTLR